MMNYHEVFDVVKNGEYTDEQKFSDAKINEMMVQCRGWLNNLDVEKSANYAINAFRDELSRRAAERRQAALIAEQRAVKN